MPVLLLWHFHSPALLSLPREGQLHNIPGARACELHTSQGWKAVDGELWVNTAAGNRVTAC